MTPGPSRFPNICLIKTKQHTHKNLFVNVAVVGPFQEEEEWTVIASDVVKVKGEDPGTPGSLRSVDTGKTLGTVQFPNIASTKQSNAHTHNLEPQVGWTGSTELGLKRLYTGIWTIPSQAHTGFHLKLLFITRVWRGFLKTVARQCWRCYWHPVWCSTQAIKSYPSSTSALAVKWRLLLLLLVKKWCSSFVWNFQGAVFYWHLCLGIVSHQIQRLVFGYTCLDFFLPCSVLNPGKKITYQRMRALHSYAVSSLMIDKSLR